MEHILRIHLIILTTGLLMLMAEANHLLARFHPITAMTLTTGLPLSLYLDHN
jgi:hypothetical protein